MKKFFIALSVLAALMIGVVPAQALIGMPDDQPGADAIVPFIISTDLTSGTGLNTLVVFTDLQSLETGLTTPDRSIDFDWDVMTVRSVTVADGRITGTGHEVVSTDAKTLVAEVSVDNLPDLEVVIDGVTYYAGYLYFETNNLAGTIFQNNSTIGTFYYVNLAIGQAASANIAMLEYNNNIYGSSTSQAQLNMTSGRFVEEFSPNALASAMALQENDGAAITATEAIRFGLYARFYIPSSGDANWLINYQCENAVVAGPTRQNNLDSIHINVYRKDEQVRSTTIEWPNEVNILNVEDQLPSTLFASFPKEGWFDFRWDEDGGDFPDVSDIYDISLFAFVYQVANGTYNEAWTVLNAVQRAANYTR
jgi:hypothetical protein